MNIAFKEWAVVCDALAGGRQVLILRKGGISEDEGIFRPDYDAFLLFPTYFHQSPESVIPEARPALARLHTHGAESDAVTLSHWGHVTDALEVKSLEALQALRGLHIWSDTVVEERFRRWRTDSVYALIVRVHALRRPLRLPMHPSYAGCKSWVELKSDVTTNESTPVLTDVDFDNRACAVRIALQVG
jgi:hypothetical protein